jgi:hypothetical protein
MCSTVYQSPSQTLVRTGPACCDAAQTRCIWYLYRRAHHTRQILHCSAHGGWWVELTVASYVHVLLGYRIVLEYALRFKRERAIGNRRRKAMQCKGESCEEDSRANGAHVRVVGTIDVFVPCYEERGLGVPALRTDELGHYTGTVHSALHPCT